MKKEIIYYIIKIIFIYSQMKDYKLKYINYITFFIYKIQRQNINTKFNLLYIYLAKNKTIN